MFQAEFSCDGAVAPASLVCSATSHANLGIFVNYFKYSINTAISAGFTPEMRDACPNEAGLILFSFSRASSLRPSIFM